MSAVLIINSAKIQIQEILLSHGICSSLFQKMVLDLGTDLHIDDSIKKLSCIPWIDAAKPVPIAGAHGTIYKDISSVL